MSPTEAVHGDRSGIGGSEGRRHEGCNETMVTSAASLAGLAAGQPSPEDQRLARLAYSVALSIVDERETAKDVAQVTMIALAARHERPENPEAWVTTVARNRSRNESRRRRRQDLRERVADVLTIHVVEDVDQMLVRLVVHEALASLPLRQRQAVEFSYLEGLGRREVAERMGISEESVKTHLARGFQSL